MAWFDDLRLIPLFSVYLMLTFLIGLTVRWRQYHAITSLVLGLRSRWPNLTRLLLTHRQIFLTWRTLLPLGLTLGVFAVNWVAGHFVWPQAGAFTLGELRHVWPLLPPVLGFGACMVVMDVWGMVVVGQIDVKETEGYFDLAEKWLAGWRAPVVRWLSLGYVNPRQMVSDQVRDALTQGAKVLHVSLWWTVAQTAWRIGLGLSLWVAYVCWRHGWLEAVVG